MIDKEGNTMQGQIPQKWLYKFTTVLKERSVYEIEYFEVLQARDNYKSVNAENIARFSKYTSVTEIIAVSPVIDITTALGPTVKRTVTVTDESETAIIILWSQHAQTFQIDPPENTSANEPVIALFVGILVGTYSGRLTLQSTSACKWYINIPIPKINALHNILVNHPHQIEYEALNHAKREPTNTTVRELIGLLPNEALGQSFKINIFVKDLVPNQPWWYMACSSCWKKIIVDGDSYSCRRYGVKTAEPRYRINTYGTDIDIDEKNKSPTGEFMFFGNIAQKIVGKPPMLLLTATEGHQGYVPSEIKDIIGCRYELIVEMSKGSLQSDNPTFRVRSVLSHLNPSDSRSLNTDHAPLLLHNNAHTELSHEDTSVSPTLLSSPTPNVIPASAFTPPTPAIAYSSKEKTPETSTIPTDPQWPASSHHSPKRPIQYTDKKKTAKKLLYDIKNDV